MLVQIGDGALISGVARWLKAKAPGTRIVGVCARGTPAMAESFAAGRPISVAGSGTIATSLAITDPVPESVARILALVDHMVLVNDEELRSAMELSPSHSECSWAGRGGGVAALARHGASVPGERVAVLLTSAGAPAGLQGSL